MKSIKLTDDKISKFIYQTRNLRHEKPHQYERIRIKDGDVVLILYNSKKLVYNDNSNTRDLLGSILEIKEYNSTGENYTYNKISSYNNDSLLDNYSFTIGSDETGKGEWYGPLVVTAVSTSHEDNLKLKRIGVTDSKKLSTKQIYKLYPKIEKLGINSRTIILKPFSYNRLYQKFTSKGKNLNHLLAYLHSKVITELLQDIQTTDVLVIIDKFDYKKMNEYLNINDKIKVIQESNGEKYIPVATSSIIAKYNYEQTLKEIEERYNINLRKTKPKNINKDVIDKVAKTHFKNVKPYAY
ncbi:ribonuclease HIII [Methanosphaera sp.]|jgi:ribonuclease HIII|uniref:ribonuclease HIII n=1 Tax=Methanosphaera sp. TaxID=2666342 RepID=UPI003D8A95A9